MLQISTKQAPTWLQDYREAHAALFEYGLHRLEPAGWRALGVGSLTVAGAAFRYFAVDVAADWAALEFRGRDGVTFGEVAQRAGFAPRLQPALASLGRSRLRLFRVVSRRGSQPRLFDVRTHVHVMPVANIRPSIVLPTDALVIARLVASPHGALLVSSAVVDDDLHIDDGSSRSLLLRLLARASDLDVLDRGSVLEPRLIGYRPDEVARLDRALTSLDENTTRSLTRRSVAGGELVAERAGASWRVSLRGQHAASAERIAPHVAHPFDVELMYQLGITGYVLDATGDIGALAHACAQRVAARTAA